MAQSNDLTLTAKVVVAHEARIAALEKGSQIPGGGVRTRLNQRINRYPIPA